MADAPKLEPCPFCGRDNVKVFGPVGWHRRYGISHSCRTFFGGSGDFTIGAGSEAEAIAAWNTRADLIDMDVLRRVEAALETGRLFIGGDVAEDGGLEMCDIGLRTDFEAASTALTDLRAMMEKLK